MRQISQYCITLLLFLFSLTGISKVARSQNEMSIVIHYYAVDNHMQYLLVETKLKKKNKFQPLENVVVQLYLDSNTAENLIGKYKTDVKGLAKAFIPVSLKEKWNARPDHDFIAVAEATVKEDEITTGIKIKKARIEIDTMVDGDTRKLKLKVLAFEQHRWIAVKAVEVKIGIQRLGSFLRIGEEESYTTDSLGQVSADFKRDSLPGDAKGNLVLVARIEDHDEYGNITVSKTVPWGKPLSYEHNFNKRTLFARGDRSPLWLELVALPIITVVWGVIIYLVVQVIKIWKARNSFE